MQIINPTAITVTTPPDPPSAVELRTRDLQRRCHLSPAIAGVIAELMLASSPTWQWRRA